MTLVGRTLDTRYLVESHIRDGGMGSIYRGRDLQAGDRYVAIKTLKPLAGNADDAARLLQEALLLARVSHPAIVTLYGHGVLPDSGESFLVLELLEGSTLKELVNEKRLTTPSAASILFQVAKAASAVHKSDIRHRDLTPGNVMVLPDGRAKVIDLGIAKAFTERASEQVDLTKADQILGTPGYIAPEYLRGGAVDHRADLFAIGGMLYFAISGRAPFEGANAREIAYATVNDEPVPLAALAPELSLGFAKIVDLCLAKDPERRPKDADTLAALLLPFCAVSDFTSANSAATHQLSTVSLAFDGPTRTDAEVLGAKVVATDWITMEDLFKKIPGEVLALWRRYEGSGSDTWNITPDPDRGGPRVLQRFLNEARTAGRLVSRMPGSSQLLRPDLADTWMSAVKAVIPPMSDVRFSGRDERGESTGGEIRDPVQASVSACAHFATALRLGAAPLKPAAPFATQGTSIPGVVERIDRDARMPLSIVFDPKDADCVRRSGLQLAVRVERNEEPRAKDVSVVLHSLLIDGGERPQPRGKRFSLLDTRTTEYVADVSPGVPRYYSLLNQVEHATYRDQGEAAWQLHTEHTNQVMHGKKLELVLLLQSDYRTEGVRLVFELAPGPRFLLAFVQAFGFVP